MAYEAKTRPSAKNVAEFIRSLEHPVRREEAAKLVEIFREATGEEPILWGESIIGFGSYRYRYPSGHRGEAAKTGFSPRKAAISLYLFLNGDARVPWLQKLGKHRAAKGCVYVNRLADIDAQVLSGMIRESVRQVDALYPREVTDK